MIDIHSPNERFNSKGGAIVTLDASVYERFAELKADKSRSANLSSDEVAEADALAHTVESDKALQKKAAKVPYRLYHQDKFSFWNIFDWSWNCKVIWVSICVIVMLLNAAMNFKSVGVNAENPLMFSELKPGSYEVVYDLSGNVKGYNEKLNATDAKRTIHDEIPSDAEGVTALAYKLYQIGNKAMVASPYAAYYEKGDNASNMGNAELPLQFNTIDVRNNEEGKHFRQTLQTIKPGVELPGIVGLMGQLSVIGKRWYVEAGQADSFYTSTVKTNKDSGTVEFNWDMPKDNSKMNEKRTAIAFHPIPYTAPGVKGKIDNKYKTDVVEATGTYWEYDEASGYSLPYYTDGAGRIIGYEKTDQHICYDATHASKEDANGTLIEDYFTTIKESSVTYNAEEGYYEVTLEMDSTKEYTHIDTLWALQDNEGAKDETAKFTRLAVKFQLWDNGYFKKWEMWENWEAPRAYGILEMKANQYYVAVFSYDKNDCDISNYYSV